MLPSSGRMIYLQQGCERTQAVWSCWASGWSGLTHQLWSPEIPETTLRYNKWEAGAVVRLMRLKCRFWDLSGASRAAGGPSLMLLFKQFSLPGHLIKQQQSPLGHVWKSHHFGFLQYKIKAKLARELEKESCCFWLFRWLVLPEPASPSSPEWTWMKSSAWNWRHSINRCVHLFWLKHIHLKPMRVKPVQKNSLSLEIWHICFLILLLKIVKLMSSCALFAQDCCDRWNIFLLCWIQTS